MRFGVLIVVLLATGCGPPMTFNADNPGKTYPERVKVASRIPDKGGCESIGTLTFDNPRQLDADEVIDAVAAKVAALGGTHYVVRDRTERRRGKERPASPVIDVLICDGSDD